MHEFFIRWLNDSEYVTTFILLLVLIRGVSHDVVLICISKLCKIQTINNKFDIIYLPFVSNRTAPTIFLFSGISLKRPRLQNILHNPRISIHKGGKRIEGINDPVPNGPAHPV